MDVIKQTLKLLMNKTPANPEQFLIPIIVQALQDTMKIEMLVNKICKSELVSNINNIKNGGVEVSYFGAILQKIFGENNTSNGTSLNPVSRDGRTLKNIKKLLFLNGENNQHDLTRTNNTLEIEPKITNKIEKTQPKCIQKREVKNSFIEHVDGVYKQIDVGNKTNQSFSEVSHISGKHQLSITHQTVKHSVMDDITSIFNKPKIQEYNTLIKSNSNGSKMEPLKKFNDKEDPYRDWETLH